MSNPDLSGVGCAPFFKKRQPKVKKQSAAEKREGMSAAHLVLVRKLPCCICRGPGGEAHHLKLGTGERGMGLRSTDKNTVPMCNAHHGEIERAGSRNEWKWFQQRGINCLDLAAGLWAVRGDLEAMKKVLAAHWGMSK